VKWQKAKHHFPQLLRSNDIIASIDALRKRGTEFLDIPDTYYRELKKHLATSKVKVKEDLALLQKLKILIDYDDNGYLLQVIFKTSFTIGIFDNLDSWFGADLYQATSGPSNCLYRNHSTQQSSRIWGWKLQGSL